MKKKAILVNTARKEIINELDLIKLMEERTEIKYFTDLTPDENEQFKNKFGEDILLHPKKWELKLKKPILILEKPNQIIDFFKTRNTKFQVNK